MASDQHAVDVVGLPGDGGDDLSCRQAIVFELVEEPIFPLDEMVRQLFDHVADIAEFDQTDDMAMESEHTVHARQRPVGQPLGEWQAADQRMV